LPDLVGIQPECCFVISFPNEVSCEGQLREDDQLGPFFSSLMNFGDDLFEIGLQIQENRTCLINSHFHFLLFALFLKDVTHHANTRPSHTINADLTTLSEVFFVDAILNSWKKMSRKYRQIKVGHYKKNETFEPTADTSGSALCQGFFMSTDKGLSGVFQGVVVAHIVGLAAVSLYGIKAFRVIRLQVIFRGLVRPSFLAKGDMPFQLGYGK